jgi:hypothetical protein
MQAAPRAGEPGTYVLLLRSIEHRSIQIGRLGVLHLEPGYYAYAGSALGRGVSDPGWDVICEDPAAPTGT